MGAFTTKNGIKFSGIAQSAYTDFWATLKDQYALQDLQLIEGAAYSMAMVVRFALGLTAREGKVITLATDTVAGAIAVATFRHLVTAGADGVVITESMPSSGGELHRQLESIQRLGIPIISLPELLSDDANRFLENCHNLICGAFSRTSEPSQSLCKFIEILNEAATPIHSVEAPLGVNVDSGVGLRTPLYSSSTLSLGIPFQGLAAGKDFVGRHYLCDVSCPRELYERFGTDLTQAFAEQPVVQITPGE